MNQRKLWALVVAPTLATLGLLLAFLALCQITVRAAPDANSPVIKIEGQFSNSITPFLKSVDRPYGVAGQRRTYQIVFHPTQDVARAQLTDRLPSMVTWADNLSASSGSASYSSGTLTWTGTLTTDVPVTITYDVTVKEGPETDVYTDVHNYAVLDDGQGNVYTSTSAIFAVGRPFGIGSDRTFAIDFGDADGNGTLDLAVGNHGQNQVCWNKGDGRFNCQDEFGGGATFDVEWGDMDGDGYLDLVVSNSMSQANLVCLNNQDHSFTCTPFSYCSGPGAEEVCFVALGDVDNDGDLDIALGTRYPGSVLEPDMIYYNNGDATFPITDTACQGHPTLRLAFGDVDQDGWLDLAVVGHFWEYICINDGTGHFTETRWLSHGPFKNTWSVALGDADKDGDLDVAVVRREGNSNEVYVNNGSGYFPESLLFGPAWEQTWDVVWGDADGDGRLDLATGNTNRPTVVYFNEPIDTTPGFTLTNPLVLGVSPHRILGVDFGDANHDSGLDLAVGSDGGQNIVYLNHVLAPIIDDDEDEEGGPTIPEPATLTLLGLGVAGLAGYVQRQRRAKRKPTEE